MTGRNEIPESWAEIYDRLGDLVASDAAAQEWVRQAIESKFGVADVWDLPASVRGVAFQRTAGALLTLEDGGDVAFDPDQRRKVAAAFAPYFDGAVVDGPPWRVTPFEERPTHDEWLAAVETF